jgi:hypothetical protein
VGGFDEAFRHPAGEDTDLAWRALDLGARAVFVPDALVDHDVRPSSVTGQVRDTVRWGSIALVVSRHPQVRGLLESRFFWRTSHRSALLAAAGLVAVVGLRGARRGVGLAAVAPYLHLRLVAKPLPHTSRRDRLRLVPAALLVDLSEVAVLAAASARYRTLVL